MMLRSVVGWSLLAVGALASVVFLSPRSPSPPVREVEQALPAALPARWFYPRGNVSARDLLALGGHFHGMALLWPGPAVVGATHLGIFVSGDGGRSWQLINPDFSVHGVGRVAASRDGKVLIAGGEGIGLKRSEDGGATWTSIRRELPPREVRALAMVPTDANRLAVWIGDSLGRSEDGGRHWSLVTLRQALPPVLAPAFHPARPGQLYVGTERGVWITRDSGHTWLPPSPGAPVGAILSLAIPLGRPDLLLVGAEDGAFLSGPELSGWRPLPPLSKELGPIVAFAFGPREHDAIFVMTHRGQILRHSLRDLLWPRQESTGWTALDLEPGAAACVDPSHGEFQFDPC